MTKSDHPSAGRESKPHIGLYGSCNAGKSTLLNFLTRGDFAVVSDQPGTTTDPVRKHYEILGFAPVVLIDTAGWDDRSTLGAERLRKTEETLAQIDLALLVFRRWGRTEEELRLRLIHDDIPHILVYNRRKGEAPPTLPFSCLTVDAELGDDAERDGLLAAIRQTLPQHAYTLPSLFDGRADEGDTVLLVCPIDDGAPAGRLILPQVQAIRHLLDKRAIAVVVQPTQIAAVLALGLRPRLVVTDSQAFTEVRAVVPKGIEITSFSILLAQMKGDPVAYAEGLERIEALQNGNRVLILENCLHQTSCHDIGRNKIPALLKAKTGRSLNFDVVSGLAPLPEDLSEYALAVQCGGCMVTRSQLQNRIRAIRRAGVPVTNYGMLLNKLTNTPDAPISPKNQGTAGR
jgi:[FeFe] hydrogenase H-cluster maturation GTPase HydF